MTVQWSGAAPGYTCLDLCCGSGDLAFLLARQVGASGTVYGADFAPALLAVAQQRAEQNWPITVPQPALHWVEADALALPFETAQFDAVTMGYGLRNVTDIPRSLGELYRVLKPGAKVAILDFHRPASPLMQRFQQWYLDQIVVPAADRHGLTADYAYISPSLDRFPVGSEQVNLAKQAGFSQATHFAIAGGLMGVLVACR